MRFARTLCLGPRTVLADGNVRRTCRLLSWLLPLASVVYFVALYSLAAFVYPGGARNEPARRGFSFIDNYWCDLLDATTYGGLENPARPIALAAMIGLCAGLSVLWWSTPVLFAKGSRRGHLVRAAGIGCATLVPWVGSSFHDLAIDAAGLLGAVAFVATVTSPGARTLGGVRSTLAEWIVLALAVLNYLVWQTGFGLQFLPFLQKLAFAAFLIWVVWLSLRVRRASDLRQLDEPVGIVPYGR